MELKGAAAVFNFIVPEYLEDDVVVGKICGTSIYAGEIRRLNQALYLEPDGGLDQELLDILRRPNHFTEEHLGGFTQAIKYYREKTSAHLIDAKSYVERLCAKNKI